MLNTSYLDNLNLTEAQIGNLSAVMREREDFQSVEDAVAKAKSNPTNENLIEAFCEIQAWGGRDAWRHKGKWMTVETLEIYKQLVKAVSNIPNNSGYYDYESILPPTIKINGLGISYHSKHLKFLNNKLVVYDSYISQKIGDKGETINGYKSFHRWCAAKAESCNVEIIKVEEAVWQKILENDKKTFVAPKRETLKKQIDDFKKEIGLY